MTKMLDCLFRDQLVELHEFEEGCEQLFGLMAEAAEAPAVRRYLEQCATQSSDRLKRLTPLCVRFDGACQRQISPGQELVNRISARLDAYQDEPEIDIVIISAAQTILYTQEARYWAASRMASSLGRDDLKTLLVGCHDRIARGRSTRWQHLEAAAKVRPQGAFAGVASLAATTNTQSSSAAN